VLRRTRPRRPPFISIARSILGSADCIREMSIANPLWGAPRIHGELLKLGIDIGQTSVAKYIWRGGGPSVAGVKDVPS
jgi:hypothetical protein